MRDSRPSTTAAFVAACRGLSSLLPVDARLVEDPLGARFAGPLASGAARIAAVLPPAIARAAMLPILPWVAYMQVRTHAIDLDLLRFLGEGGRQLVILGAGFDARAARLVALEAAHVFEVDHPATQSRKRRILDESRVRSTARYLAWDFERDRLDDLPARLAELGHDPTRPTFTVWEGVTMYLTAEAIDSTVAAVRGYSAPGSRLAFNYVEQRFIDRPGVLGVALANVVRRAGEPFRSGFAPEALPAWLAARGFRIHTDQSFAELAQEHLPSPYRELVRAGRRLAVAERTAVAEACARV